jgi:hypothetical protein
VVELPVVYCGSDCVRVDHRSIDSDRPRPQPLSETVAPPVYHMAYTWRQREHGVLAATFGGPTEHCAFSTPHCGTIRFEEITRVQDAYWKMRSKDAHHTINP